MSPSKLILVLLLHATYSSVCALSANQTISLTTASATVRRTRSFALLFSCLQCISETDQETAEIREINRHFKPEKHRNKYQNKKALDRLLHLVRENEQNPHSIHEPFTYTPAHLATLQIILDPLYANAHNWGLFFNTSAWLIERVNGAKLFMALKIVAAEKFTNTVVTASAAEVFPQLYIGTTELAKVAPNVLGAGKAPVQAEEDDIDTREHPLYYYMTDPGLNEFRLNWFVENPPWWLESKYGVKKDRIGELFFYLHHQIIARYNAELLSNGLPFVTPIKLEPHYTIPESYYPDVVNVNFHQFHARREGEQMKDLDDGHTLDSLRTSYNRLQDGISKHFLKNEDGSPAILLFPNASDVLGAAAGASSPRLNPKYYGNLRGGLHWFLGYLNESKHEGHEIGVEAMPATAMRDPVFYRFHKLLDTLYLHLKSNKPTYRGCQINFRGIKIDQVAIKTDIDGYQESDPRILTTFMDTNTYDISTAARPCQGVGGPTANADVEVLHYDPFTFIIKLTSTRAKKADAMVRIFLLPVVDHHGHKLDTEISHRNAIQLDLFHVNLKPNQKTTIRRKAIDSTVIRHNIPGIKKLHTVRSPSPDGLLKRDMKRACGWPHNLFIPKGTTDGLKFKLVVMLSELSQLEVKEMQPHFAYCGMRNGLPYPDPASMGFPFDRPGTRFVAYDEVPYDNIIEVPVVIKHRGSDGLN